MALLLMVVHSITVRRSVELLTALKSIEASKKEQTKKGLLKTASAYRTAVYLKAIAGTIPIDKLGEEPRLNNKRKQYLATLTGSKKK